MYFNSIGFALFFALVFFAYWFIFNKSVKRQNIFLVLASYFFYGCWDWRFTLLLAASTIIGYCIGKYISQSNCLKNKKQWLILGITLNIGLLGYFKYFNFFADSFADLLQLVGLSTNYTSIQIMLPLGVSFYTFRNLSYIFDIYYGKLAFKNTPLEYALYMSFFPLIISGPIERAGNLLPQIEQKRRFNNTQATNGLKQILWGLFKKMVIADNCGTIVDIIYKDYHTFDSFNLILAAVLFSFQIYGDFSGYTDMALGIARVLGFELSQNFRYPYFSRDMAEFWRRWHITLSTWFRDYVYIPLGGNRRGILMTICNVMIVFMLSGFWHGAGWTFIIWGVLNGLCALPGIVFQTKKNRTKTVAENCLLPSPREGIQMFVTFILTCFIRIFFRSETLQDSFSYNILLINNPNTFSGFILPGSTLLAIIVFFALEWNGRRNSYAIEKIGYKWKPVYRWLFYYLILLCIYYFSGNSGQEFIYFQF